MAIQPADEQLGDLRRLVGAEKMVRLWEGHELGSANAVSDDSAVVRWDERIELDVWYVENRSPWLDLKIIAKTPRALFGGTYKGQTGGWGKKSALNSPRPDSNGSSPLPTRKPE